ncbi:hypothetical protein RAB80_004925 [Fusarium oxysporum f. sp. vasinfectum]|nr:hypothetical protein RAB80_004925 [Fusarium oxysporum f. sp. vasinfectum]
MENVSKPPRRRRHAAMRDERELNDQGERARHERGMKPSQRSRSPPSNQILIHLAVVAIRTIVVVIALLVYRPNHHVEDQKSKILFRVIENAIAKSRRSLGGEARAEVQATTISAGHRPRQPNDIENDLNHGHEADRLHQSTTWLHPEELVHHLARINGRQVLSGFPRGDSFHHDHLQQVGNGDLEKGRPVGVILREAILEEAITRSITKNHISVTISIPHHPNTLRTITRLHDHPTGHHVVDGMVISPTHLSILKGVVTVPQVALLAIIIPILHGHRHTPLRQARCSSTLRGGSYRGGYRGGGFRGRGRGGFKNSHWNSGPPSRGHHDDLGNERFSNVDDHGNTGSEPMDVQEEVFQSHDELGEDTSQSVQDRAGPLTTPNRPPPSGPGGSSASSRPRHERRHPPEGPRVAPRMRKVMKIMKRPKPRPTLPADLVDSESVFFRKPGNESVVGSGTYGKVFKGLNVYTKGMVALKRIRMEGERDGFPVTAIREIKLLQSLRHVNIVNLQEVMVEKNDCFMVFEYLSHDLTGLLNHPTFKLETAQKKDLAKQMFEGLDYLHTRGVLHRDIKAANILVSNEGVLKIADFGLARFYAKRHQLDYTNRVITIWYRSPELLLGETKYTAAVDVWSAACVMVEIFDRNAIFPGDGTELSQLEKIYNVMGTPNLKDWPNLIDMAWFELLRPTVKRRNVFAEKYRDKMSPAAFDLLSAMFHYDPAKRPSAAQVLQHAYFTEEAPAARQATELATHNDWHEFESKALRKENDRREREAKKLAKENAGRDKEKDKKRINEGTDQRDTKRLQVDKNGGNKPTPAVAPPNSTSEA